MTRGPESGPDRASPGVTAAASVLWFLVLWLASGLLDEQAGVGEHRTLHRLLQSDEALLAETFAEAAPARTGGPRWTGRPGAPADVVILGTSPSAWDLEREAARGLEERLRARVFKVSPNVTPIDRLLTRFDATFSCLPFDVLVVEVCVPLANDHVLGFRGEIEEFRTDWTRAYAIRDEELLRLREELGLPPAHRGAEAADFVRLRRTLERNLWDEADPGRREFRERDPTSTSDPRVLEHQVLYWMLGRLRATCRERGVGLVVYAPPTLRSIVGYVTGEGATPIDPAPHGRDALRAAAEAFDFKVLDYADWTDEVGLYRDPLHLNVRGASPFSERFFADMERVLAAGGEDRAYEVGRRGP